MRLKDVSGRWDSMKHFSGVYNGIDCHIQGSGNKWFFYCDGYNSLRNGEEFESKEIAKKKCEEYLNKVEKESE